MTVPAVFFMWERRIVRLLLFIIFFGVGAGAVGLSVLSKELVRHYENKLLLKQAESTLVELEKLSADYSVLIAQIRKHPEVLKRVAAVTMGIDPNEPDTVYPHATARQLAAVRQTLEERGQTLPVELPKWLKRISRTHYRYGLFFAGALLVINSFIFFGAKRIEDFEEDPELAEK